MASEVETYQILRVEEGQPLIAVPFEENGKRVVYYFNSQEKADAFMGKLRVERVRELAGAWSDLDWEEMADELERIRRESKPSPIVDIDE